MHIVYIVFKNLKNIFTLIFEVIRSEYYDLSSREITSFAPLVLFPFSSISLPQFNLSLTYGIK